MALKDKIKAKQKKKPNLVLPIVQAHRLAHPNHIFSEEAIELAQDILRRNDDADRIGRNSPSSGGDCLRSAIFSFFGYPGGKKFTMGMLNRFKDGDYGHLMWQLYFFDIGILEKAEFAVEIPKWIVKGTLDGILAIPDFNAVGEAYDARMTREDVRDYIEDDAVPVTRLVAEIKRMNEYRWSWCRGAGKPEPKIVWQGNMYYHGARHEAVKLNEEKPKGVAYWLENKNNNEIVEFDLKPSKSSKARYDEFYGAVAKYAREHKLPPLPRDKDGAKVDPKTNRNICQGCWHKDRCLGALAKKQKDIGPHDDKPLGNFALVHGIE